MVPLQVDLVVWLQSRNTLQKGEAVTLRGCDVVPSQGGRVPGGAVVLVNDRAMGPPLTWLSHPQFTSAYRERGAAPRTCVLRPPLASPPSASYAGGASEGALGTYEVVVEVAVPAGGGQATAPAGYPYGASEGYHTHHSGPMPSRTLGPFHVPLQSVLLAPWPLPADDRLSYGGSSTSDVRSPLCWAAPTPGAAPAIASHGPYTRQEDAEGVVALQGGLAQVTCPSPSTGGYGYSRGYDDSSGAVVITQGGWEGPIAAVPGGRRLLQQVSLQHPHGNFLNGSEDWIAALQASLSAVLPRRPTPAMFPYSSSSNPPSAYPPTAAEHSLQPHQHPPSSALHYPHSHPPTHARGPSFLDE